ncbi:Pre-mRNA-splicing factor 38B [Phytophthora cinnamomi]|uniref:Pre-mRNA-splicing factor 38B n=1 Tax=Phytophthora cinnamomi TaxID=4785 RepID=UPI0035598BFD|nr:Pre-mRNA-splicing factor 38B [Phytophthora cinnamomi]
MYADEENEPAMYDAVIDSVEEGNQFWVSFPAYGLRNRSRSQTRSKSGGGDMTGYLLQQVRERERRKAEAVGRDYASASQLRECRKATSDFEPIPFAGEGSRGRGASEETPRHVRRRIREDQGGIEARATGVAANRREVDVQP